MKSAGALVQLHPTSEPLHVLFLQPEAPSQCRAWLTFPELSSLGSNTASSVRLFLVPRLK